MESKVKLLLPLFKFSLSPPLGFAAQDLAKQDPGSGFMPFHGACALCEMLVIHQSAMQREKKRRRERRRRRNRQTRKRRRDVYKETLFLIGIYGQSLVDDNGRRQSTTTPDLWGRIHSSLKTGHGLSASRIPPSLRVCALLVLSLCCTTTTTSCSSRVPLPGAATP